MCAVLVSEELEEPIIVEAGLAGKHPPLPPPSSYPLTYATLFHSSLSSSSFPILLLSSSTPSLPSFPLSILNGDIFPVPPYLFSIDPTATDIIATFQPYLNPCSIASDCIFFHYDCWKYCHSILSCHLK